MGDFRYSQALGDGTMGFYGKAKLKWGTTNFSQAPRRGAVNANAPAPEAGTPRKTERGAGPPSIRSQRPALPYWPVLLVLPLYFFRKSSNMKFL